jgi:predicted anti-sigma-YlaC factor YlaD
MTCTQLVELVTEYLEEALSQVDRVRFEQHLETCGYCRRHVDQVRRTIKIVGCVQHEPVAPERKQELLDLFRAWKQGDTQ